MQLARENTAIHDDAGHLEATRIDESAWDQVATGPNESTPRGSVEDMLAVALARASEAGRWDIVAQLARELQARRLACAGVRQLDAARGKESSRWACPGSFVAEAATVTGPRCR